MKNLPKINANKGFRNLRLIESSGFPAIVGIREVVCLPELCDTTGVTEAPAFMGVPPGWEGEPYQGGIGTEVLVRPKAKTKRPPMYQVVLLNDDYTPMDFVVEVLKKFFHKSDAEAVAIMLAVHHKGAGVCGVFPRDVAETKAEQVISYARQHEHPLQCVVEQAP